MRLTKQMKNDLFNIIKNKLTPPITEQVMEDWKKELQEVIYANTIPAFKEIAKTYVECGLTTSNLLFSCSYDDPKVGSKRSKGHINVVVPYYNFLHDVLKIGRFGIISATTNIKEYAPAVRPLVLKMRDVIKQHEEFLQEIFLLKHTIDKCTTDSALAKLYPEFVKYFPVAGIVEKPKQLPATYGLPDSLTKYGLKL